MKGSTQRVRPPAACNSQSETLSSTPRPDESPSLAESSWQLATTSVLSYLKPGERDRVRFQVLVILKTSLINTCNN
jgi:hypothetical protein